MKHLLFGLLVFGTMSSFAGILENKESGESIQFQIINSTSQVEVTSNAAGVKNTTIQLRSLDKDSSSIGLFAATDAVIAFTQENTDGAPIGYVALPATAAYDLVLLPIKAPLKVLQNVKFKKDFNKLMKAVSTNETVTVSSSRFKRIIGLL